MDEYLRLPKGMHIRKADWLAHEAEILKLHALYGKSIGCTPIKYAPLGFKSTFTREINTANDKTYELEDRAGRQLVLSCDSTPSVLREYAFRAKFQPERIAFIAPLFRYRNDKAHNRHFTQIGYSLINEKDPDEAVDFHIIQLLVAMKKLTSKLGIKTEAHFNDFSAFRQTIAPYIGQETINEFIHKFQFSDPGARIQMLKSAISDDDERRLACDLFESGVIEIDGGSGGIKLPKAYEKTLQMGKAMHEFLNEPVYFCPSDLHCIETICAYRVRLVNSKGKVSAEGGKYSNYANRFSGDIKSFWSVATGVELLEREGAWNAYSERNQMVALYNFGVTDAFLMKIIKAFQDTEYIISYQGNVNGVSVAVKSAHRKNYAYCLILGQDEEVQNRFKMKRMSDNATMEFIANDNCILEC
ncbi:MAG: ATP phosphoribosyltransferase regulatory subunit [Clostridiales bacterium]|nr:ATP phosphoribosyltransferase regulatory subunit [Clostridiales bacterium]